MEHGPTAFPVPGATPSRRLGLAPTTSKFGYRSSRGLLYNSAELSLLERRIGLASTTNRDSFGSLQRGITPRVDPATLTIPHREGLRPLVGKLQSPPMVSSRTLHGDQSEKGRERNLATIPRSAPLDQTGNARVFSTSLATYSAKLTCAMARSAVPRHTTTSAQDAPTPNAPRSRSSTPERAEFTRATYWLSLYY